MNGEQLKGHLPLLLLSIFEGGPAHGYAVVEELRRRSSGELDLPEGTVYPALHRLETSGLLASRWRVTDGRRRRVYALTAKGRKELAKERRSWSVFSRTITAVAGEAT